MPTGSQGVQGVGLLGPMGSRGPLWILLGQGNVWGILWGLRVGLMSLLMIQKAYSLYMSDPDFYCGRAGQPEQVQEILVDLKI